MPDVRATMSTAAGVGLPRRASVGGLIPAAARPGSVSGAVMPPGAAGPRGAQAAAFVALVVPEVVPVAVLVADAQDVRELERMQRQPFTGERPSGFGEAWKNIREMYQKKERDAREDAEAIARNALAAQQAAAERYNEFARRNGLPEIPLPSDILARILDAEGTSYGSEPGFGGLTAGVEVMPAWRADP